MAASLKASPSGLRIIDVARSKKGWNKADYAWCDAANVSMATLKRFWQCQAIAQDSFVRICAAAECNWEEIIENVEHREIKLPDWKQCCKRMLAAQKGLTTNQITARDGIKFSVDNEEKEKEIYIFGKLVEIKRQGRFRLTERLSPESGSLLYTPQGDKALEYSKFIAKLQVSSREEPPPRIAILGEPGVGKTTFLQKIALSVADKTNYLPIWISFGDLQEKSIAEYLLSDWLKIALGEENIPEAVKDNLITQFGDNKILLLLDGIDEVGMEPVKILESVGKQLTGWVGKATVILTCRLNVWYESKNPLTDFQTYQLPGFELKEQVEQFIANWFKYDKVKKWEDLQKNFTQSGNQRNYQWLRLQDMAKNPLRLAMLCYILQEQLQQEQEQEQEKKFPDTWFSFYKQLVEEMYEWKKERFPLKQEERQNLDKSLAQLALWGIERNRFLFSSAHLEAKLRGKSLLLSLQIGLINQVGMENESVNQKVYAFCHPALQEYFAVLGIGKDKGWRYFLDLEKGTTLIFEIQWREVFVLWCETGESQREEGISLIYQLISLASGRHSQDKITQQAAETLKELLDSMNEKLRQSVALGFRRLAIRNSNTHPTGNSHVIEILTKLLELSDDDITRLEAIWSLGTLGAGSDKAKNTLNYWQEKYSHEELREEIRWSLIKIKKIEDKVNRR